MGRKRRDTRSARFVTRTLMDILAGKTSLGDRRADLERHGCPVDEAAENLLRRLTSLLHAPDAALVNALEQAPPLIVESVIGLLCRRKQVSALAMLKGHLSSRPLEKALAKALYQLSSQGITAAEEVLEPARERRPALTPRSTEDPEAWVTPRYEEGVFAMSLFLPFPGKATMCVATIADRQGVTEIRFDDETARAMRRQLKARTDEDGRPIVVHPIPVSHALFLIDEAAATNKIKGIPLPFGVERVRRDVKHHWNIEPQQARLERREGIEPITGHSVGALGPLLSQPPVLSWTIDAGHLVPVVQEIFEDADSPIIVDDQVKKARRDRAIDAAVEAYYTPERRHRYARRLEELALALDADGKRDIAELAWGCALALAQADTPPTAIPFALYHYQINLLTIVNAVMSEVQQGADRGIEEAGERFDVPPEKPDGPRIIVP